MKPTRFVVGVAMLAACSTELPHEAPFDPNAPFEKQAKASLSGTIRLEGETDFSQVTLDLQNESRTYNVDTAADGAVSLTGVVPGEYALKLRTRYFQAVTETVTVELGERVDLGTRTLAPLRGRVLGLATSERVQGANLVSSGGVQLALRKTASIRSAVSAAPGLRPAAAAATAVTLRTVSGVDGSFEFNEVPAGGYTLYAASTETGERAVGNVTVTGEGDLTVDPIVLRPLTGYFEILGTAHGVPSSTFTSVAAVNLQLQQSNAVQVKVAVSTDGTTTNCDLSAATPEALPETTLRPLTFTSEGKKLVCVSYIDADGKETEPIYGSITYDATPPTLPSLAVNGGAQVVSSNLVTLSLSAVDTLSGTATYKVNSVNDFGAVSAKPYQPADVFTFTGGDGVKTVWVTFGDHAGNYSAPVSASVLLDTVPPALGGTVTLTQIDGTPLTSGDTIAEGRVKLISSVSEATSALEMQITTNGSFAGQPWVPYDPTKTIDLPDGASNISVRVRDGAGHVIDVVTGFALSTDTTPPTGTLTIAPTAVTNPTITVTATGSADAIEVELAFDPGFVTSLGRFVPGPIAVNLTGGDGTKTVYGRFFDAAGNASALVGDTVTLDTAPPQILSFTLAQASPTKDNPVTVNYSVAGAAELRITEGLDCSGVRESVGAGTKSFTVSASEGNKEIRLQFFDAAGNASECAVRTIYFDPNPPVVGTLQLNYGQAATSSNVVTLSFPGVSGATKVILSEDAGFAGADWQTYADTKTFVLSAGNGGKTVYAKVADDAGHVVNLPSASITLDTTPPTSPSIFAAHDVTSQTSVTLFLSAGLVSEMWITQDDPTFTTGAWETYSGSKLFALAGTDGTKTIYAKFKKSTGVETSVVSDTVVLDRTAPILPSVQINGGAAVASSNIVTLNLSAVDPASGLATYKINTTNDFAAVSPKPYQPTDVFSFVAGDGPKTVWVTIADKAGLYSTPVSATVLLDTTAPAVGGAVMITKLDGTPLTAGATLSDARVQLISSVTDLSALEMQITTNGSFSGVAWVPYEPAKVIDITSGTPSISARVRDRAGLMTDILTAFTLTVDNTPPVLTFSRNSAATTNNLTVALALSATEGSQAQVSEDAAFAGSVWFTTGNTTVTLPAGDGLRTIYARVRDTAGNFSVTKQVTLQIDTAAPTGESVVINGNAGFTKTAAVTLSIGGSGATQMQVSGNSSFAGASWVTFATTYAHTITGTEGTVNIYIRLRDDAGNTTDGTTDAIVFDAQAPTAPSIAIAEQPKTRQSYVTLTLSAVGATELMLADDASFAGRPWQPVTTSTTWTLPPGDGTKTVYVKYRDAAGNESATASAVIILDTTPPVAGSLMLNGGAAITNNTTVHYAIAATDALSEPLQMQVAGEPGFGDAVWTAFAASGSKSIAAGDGVRSLYVRFRDAVGNVSLASSGSFILDQTGPQLASVAVNEGRPYAMTTVSVDFQVGSWAAGDMLQVATAADFSGATEYPANAGVNRVSYTLTGPDGAKTVYARAMDTLGNFGPAWATAVTLDTLPPTVTGSKAMVLANDDNYTATRFVNLELHVSGATEMLVWNSGQLLYATWEPFQANTLWALPFGDGVHTVQARFRDAARNEIQGYSDVITLDTAVPTSPSVTINGGAGYITSPTVALTLSATGATGMQLSGDGVFDTEPVIAYDTSDSWTFPGAEGQKTIYARFCDNAGNCSQVASSAVILDTTLPTGAIAVNQGSARTDSSTVTLNVTAGDAVSGLQGIKLANSLAALATTDVVTYEATKIWTLAAPTGAGVEATKAVWLQVIDRAGLASTPLNDEIVFDSLAPTGGLTLPAAVTRETLIGVDLSFVPDTSHMRLSAGNACAGGNWVEASTSALWTLAELDGPQSVSVRFRDSVGNESLCYSAGITLDRTGPTPVSLTLTGSGAPQPGYSDSADVTAAFSTTDSDCAIAELAEDVGFLIVTATHSACNDSIAYPFGGGDGPKTLYLRYADTLGNIGPLASAAIVVDTTEPTFGGGGAFSIAEGAYVKSAGITLVMNALGATRMRVSQDALCTGTPETYSNTRPLTLTGGDGPKTVSVRFEDYAGNTSTCFSRPVTLDTALPTVATVIVGTEAIPGRTAQQVVTLNITAGADAHEMRISNLSGFPDAGWQPVSTGIAWPLYAGDGLKTVYAQVRDRAGNLSTVATPSITLDQTAPNAPALQVLDIDDDGFALSATTVELQWNSSGDPNIAGYELQRFVNAVDSTFMQIASPAPSAVEYADDVSETAGYTHQYRIRAIDDLGNYSEWSNLAVAAPIQPIEKVCSIQTGPDRYQLDWTVQPGTYDIQTKGYWYDVTRSVLNERFDDNLLSLAFQGANGLEDGVWDYWLALTTRNQDNSLAFSGRFPMPGARHEFVSANQAWSEISVAVDTAGHAHIAYFTVVGFQLWYATNASGVWVTEAVDTAYDTGRNNSITVDAAGKVHISYYERLGSSAGNLKYATNAGGSWSFQTADSGGNVGAQSSIALDQAGWVHISYRDVGNEDLKYATNAGGSWAASTLDATNNVGYDSSIAVDSAGKIHIAYIYASMADLRYITNESGFWVPENLDTPGSVGSPALALDAADKVHISYYDSTNKDLKYATNESGSWQLSAPVTAGDVGQDSSLSIAADGSVHIVYQDSSESQLRYVHNRSGIWRISAVQSNATPSAMALDASGNIHVTFVDSLDKLVKYFTNAPNDWRQEVLASAGNTGQITAVQVDASDNVHVVYSDLSATQLKYMRNFGVTWSTEIVAAAFGDMSFVLDAAGKAHIAYYLDSSANLVYATNQNGAWANTTIDSTGDVGRSVQLALDSNGKAHIVYLDYTQNRLKYATNAQGGWQTSILESSFVNLASRPSIALDAADKVHVVYYQQSFARMRYAHNISGVWGYETAMSSSCTSSAFALDSAGQPHILCAVLGYTMTYGFRTSTGWQTEDLAILGNTSVSVSLLVDGDGASHIAYQTNIGSDLRYATNASGRWAAATLDAVGSVGSANSMQMDSRGRFHMTYHDWTNADLRYLRFRAGCTGVAELTQVGPFE